MDPSGLTSELISEVLKLGGPYLAIAWLLIELYKTKQAADECSKQRYADLKEAGERVTAALISSTKTLENIGQVQSKAADASIRTATAVDQLRVSLEHQSDRIERLEDQRGRR